MERRKYPRLNVPIFWNSSGWLAGFNRSVDVSLGGMKVYCDDSMKPGRMLDIDLMLSGERHLGVQARVVWVQPAPPDSGALFEVGLEFMSMPEFEHQQLAAMLKAAEDAEPSPMAEPDETVPSS